MKRARLLLLLLFVCLIASATFAQARRERPVPDDPALEKRLQNLSQELRCLVCQNETLAESRADLAEDLRDEIRQQMKAGKSDKEIVAFLTERYGQFILYRPQVTPATYLLWFGPFVLLLVGLVVLFAYIKQRRELIPEQPLSSDERKRAEDMLRSSSGKERA
ncbi:MAG TPA: cytochrome c-type biogenesis protein [Pyrinomonadaceae bacterium]|nr:cytochrome c-type biogenesis protein [Pyrinomonadaceae bacterium]